MKIEEIEILIFSNPSPHLTTFKVMKKDATHETNRP